MFEILVPISPADLIDRLTRLNLMSQQALQAEAEANLVNEIARLQKVANHVLPDREPLANLWLELAGINADLFALKADLQLCEDRADFGPSFVALARALLVAQGNHALIKDQINQFLDKEWNAHSGRVH